MKAHRDTLVRRIHSLKRKDQVALLLDIIKELFALEDGTIDLTRRPDPIDILIVSNFVKGRVLRRPEETHGTSDANP